MRLDLSRGFSPLHWEGKAIPPETFRTKLSRLPKRLNVRPSVLVYPMDGLGSLREGRDRGADPEGLVEE